MGTFPKGLRANQLFSSIDSDPLEKLLAILIGKTVASPTILQGGLVVGALVAYGLLFGWYLRTMRQRNVSN